MRSLRLPSLSSKQPARRGAATVETALVLPIFFMVMLGIVECGRAFMISQLLTNAAHEGSRMAIMNGTTNAQVEQTVEDVLERTAGIAAADLTISIDVEEYSGNPPTGDDIAKASKRDLCAVTVQVDYDKVNILPIKYLSGARLVGQSAMRHE